MTTREKEVILAKRFGKKFFEELADRVMNGQRMKGNKVGDINVDAVLMARQVTEALYKEWIVDKCEHDLRHLKELDGRMMCLKCKAIGKYTCNADCPDVEFGQCCHPDSCIKKFEIKDENPPTDIN